MCNNYEQHVAWKAYCKMMQDLEWGIPTQQSELDLRQADDVRIRDVAPVIRAAGNGVELAQMRWSFPRPDWFDLIETDLRTKMRGFIETTIEEERDTALSRPRYGRRRERTAADAAAAPIAGHRHGHRTRSLIGTFGTTEIAVPRARIKAKDGKTAEWKSKSPRACQWRTNKPRR